MSPRTPDTDRETAPPADPRYLPFFWDGWEARQQLILATAWGFIRRHGAKWIDVLGAAEYRHWRRGWWARAHALCQAERTGDEPMNHDLKTAPRHFQGMKSGRKTFEIRRHDRNFAMGDTLTLREYLLEQNRYTDQVLMVLVTHVMHHRDFPEAIQPGFCVMATRLMGTGICAPDGALEPGHDLNPGEARVLDVSPVSVLLENHLGERMSLPTDARTWRPEEVVHLFNRSSDCTWQIARIEAPAK